jgi:hypothetical protein
MNLSKITVFAFALLTILVFQSCNKDDSSTNSNWSIFDAPEWYAPEPDNTEAEITEATLEQPFDIVSEENDYRLCDGTRKNDKVLKEKRRFYPIARALKNLNLDDIQKEQVKGFLFDFRLCIKESVMKLRESERELIVPYNDKRKIIYDAYKNGDITRENAIEQLKELAKELKEELKENGLRMKACEEMKACAKISFNNIKEILTSEQLEKWNEWQEKLPEIDCSKKQ